VTLPERLGWVPAVRVPGLPLRIPWSSLALLGVMAAGLLLRLMALRAALDRPLDPDPQTVFMLAENMRHPYDTWVREPLWVWLAALFRWLAGGSPSGMRYFSLTVSMLLLYVTYRFVRDYTRSAGLAVLTTGILAVHGSLVSLSVRGLRDELHALCLMLVAYHVFVPGLGRARRSIGLAVSSSLIALTVITSFIPTIGLMAWSMWKRRLSWRGAGLAIVVTGTVLAPHLLNNVRLHGEPFWFTNRAVPMFYRNWEFLMVKKTGCPGCPTLEEFKKNAYSGSPIGLWEYLFGLHSAREVAGRIVRGYSRLFVEPTDLRRHYLGTDRLAVTILYFAGLVLLAGGPYRELLLVPLLSINVLAFLFQLGIDPRLVTHTVPIGAFAIALAGWALLCAIGRLLSGAAWPLRLPVRSTREAVGHEEPGEALIGARWRMLEPMTASGPHGRRSPDAPGESDAGRVVKIAYVIGTLDPGGAEGQLVALATSLDRRRFAPAVYCMASAGALAEPLVAAGVPVRSFGLHGFSVWSDPLAVARRVGHLVSALRRDRPDIAHGFLFHAYVLAALARRVTGTLVVVASRRSLGNFKRRKPHYRMAERLANRLTDLVIANSEAVRADVLRDEGLPPERIMVIHNGLVPDRFDRPPDPGMRRRLGVDGATFVVAVVANFIPYKGHRFFLEAWAQIAARAPGAVALLIGDGPARREIEARVHALRLDGSVRFLGSRPDVPDILGTVDILVHPSLEEGFSNAILEAMGARKPVVATAVGGNPEAVVHGETGLLVPPGDGRALAEAILWLLERPAQAVAFGQAGRQRVVERFELSRMVRCYESVYDRLLADKRAGRTK
jgi:L-malate glycosyltransferase